MSIRKLASDTVLYGLSSILGRFVNFLLVYLHTRSFSEAEFGILTDVYALIAFLFVIFTYRIEAAYFRFGTSDDKSEEKAFNTSLLSIVSSTIVLAILLIPLLPWLMSNPVYDMTALYTIGVLILSVDALNEIPFSRLRIQERPIRFAAIKLSSIGIIVFLNVFFLWFCPSILEQSDSSLRPLIEVIYHPDYGGIFYVLIANLIGNLFASILLLPSFLSIRLNQFEPQLWRKMIRYAVPLILMGFSFTINEVFDRKIMSSIAPGTPEERLVQLGIYGAVYKLAVVIALFTPAFRYGAEPFFFRQKNSENAPQLYADVAKFFTIAGLIGFLSVTLYIDLFKHIIDERFWQGLHVVPILLLANLCLGIYYNLSIWFKLTDRTQWGAYISIGGALLTIALNLWLIPIYSYTGAAWATLTCYSCMLVASYYFGRRYYPVPYEIKRVLGYIVFALILFAASSLIKELLMLNLIVQLGINTLFLLLFLGGVFRQERTSIKTYFG